MYAALTTASEVLAAEGDPVNLAGIRSLILGALGIMFIVGAIRMSTKAHKARSNEVAGQAMNFVFVAIVAALGLGAGFIALGGDIISFVRGGS